MKTIPLTLNDKQTKVPQDAKICGRCNEIKDTIEFNRNTNSADGRQSLCIICCHAYSKVWREENRAAIKAKKSSHRKENKDKYRSKQRSKVYGISEIEIDALIVMQNNTCAICCFEFTSKGSFHVDHSHKTGAIRGLLCPHCNKGLGMFRDDESRLSRAALYLLSHRD